MFPGLSTFWKPDSKKHRFPVLSTSEGIARLSGLLYQLTLRCDAVTSVLQYSHGSSRNGHSSLWLCISRFLIISPQLFGHSMST